MLVSTIGEAQERGSRLTLKEHERKENGKAHERKREHRWLHYHREVIEVQGGQQHQHTAKASVSNLTALPAPIHNQHKGPVSTRRLKLDSQSCKCDIDALHADSDDPGADGADGASGTVVEGGAGGTEGAAAAAGADVSSSSSGEAASTCWS